MNERNTTSRLHHNRVMGLTGIHIVRLTARCSLICAVMSCFFVSAVSGNGKSQGPKQDSFIQIHLPRKVTVEDSCFRLGQVGIIRGGESLVTRAEQINLGRISVPGQEIIVDRSVVLSRLASSGIDVSKVKLTGAEKTAVKKQQQVIKASQFVESAESFLINNLARGSVCQLNAVQMPADFVAPPLPGKIKLSTSLLGGGSTGRARVRIGVLANDKRIGSRIVSFRLKYNRRRAVALRDIPQSAAITPENVRIKKLPSDYPEPADWSPPYGFIARHRIDANSVINSRMIRAAEPKVLFKRNETVVIRINRPGLLVTTLGKALQQGRIDDYIKVRNMDSKRVILARVRQDGTVEPVL